MWVVACKPSPSWPLIILYPVAQEYGTWDMLNISHGGLLKEHSWPTSRKGKWADRSRPRLCKYKCKAKGPGQYWSMSQRQKWPYVVPFGVHRAGHFMVSCARFMETGVLLTTTCIQIGTATLSRTHSGRWKHFFSWIRRAIVIKALCMAPWIFLREYLNPLKVNIIALIALSESMVVGARKLPERECSLFVYVGEGEWEWALIVIVSGRSIPKPLLIPGESTIIHNPEMHRPITALITRETWLNCTEISHKTYYKITRFYLVSKVTLELHEVKELITCSVEAP